MTTKTFKTLHVFDTVSNADTVEWCPIEPHKNSFACGTYHLMENNLNEENKVYLRNGEVLIFTVTKDSLKKNDEVKGPGILDMKWCGKKVNNMTLLAVANAIGEVVVYNLENDKKLKVLVKCTLSIPMSEVLSLSVDWSKQNGSQLICVSDSMGNVAVLKFSTQSLSVLKKWNAHSHEAWIVCFDSFKNDLIYSGGDDGQLKVWDHRNESPLQICSVKKHAGGVTVLNSNMYEEFNLASGSYDENVFLWDTRNWKYPLKSINASGGLWRLKWKPLVPPSYLLGACIYGGFQIYDTSLALSVGEYKEHESLAYGADWCYLNENEIWDLLGYKQSFLIATCSFYDHQLRVSLWREDCNRHSP